jgi:hypothetical protein
MRRCATLGVVPKKRPASVMPELECVGERLVIWLAVLTASAHKKEGV